MARLIIGKQYSFAAAHRLIEVPEGHPCNKMHGHTYHVDVNLHGEVGPNGMVLDYHILSDLMKPIISDLDHSVLNETIPNPTAEYIAIWIWDMLNEELEKLHASHLLLGITVCESPTSWATFSGYDKNEMEGQDGD